MNVYVIGLSINLDAKNKFLASEKGNLFNNMLIIGTLKRIIERENHLIFCIILFMILYNSICLVYYARKNKIIISLAKLLCIL